MTTVTWSGKSGLSYQFGVYDLSATFVPRAGVYVLARHVGGIIPQLEALYVGETESLEDRLNTCRYRHDGFERASKMGLTMICARLVTDGAAERLRIETDLRHALNPVCNAQSVPETVLGGLFWSK